MKLCVVDSNSIMNRAFYGIKILTTKDGQYTNAIYGFFNIVKKLVDEIKPDRTVFAFDLKHPTFRHKMYTEYKAQRKGMPSELASQMPYIKEIISALGYPVVTLEGYEADDILGTLSRMCEQNGGDTYLITGDRDSLQLVDEHTTVMLATNTDYLEMTPKAVTEKYGVEPIKLIETKALMGDSSDNIPGVKGIGEKTAFSLIKNYGSVEEIYRNIENIDVTPSVRKKLIEGEELASLSRTLGTIDTNVPIGDFDEITRNVQMDNDRLYSIFSKLELHSLIKRYELSIPENLSTDEENTVSEEVNLEYKETNNISDIIKNTESIYISITCMGDDIDEMAVSNDSGIYMTVTENSDKDIIFSSSINKICSSTKAIYRYCFINDIEPQNITFDISLAGYILSPDSSEYTIPKLCGEYGINYHSVNEKNELINSACSILNLYKYLETQIKDNDEEYLYYDIELPLAEVLASMEINGFKIDTEALKAFGSEIKVLIDELEKEIYELAGHEFNINSPKQMSVVLFEELELPFAKRTKTGYSTNAEILEKLIPHHPIVAKILEYRKYTKLNSTYVEGLLKVADENDIIHSSFNQTETRTGRISSTEPNLQNIPIRSEPGSKMRTFFVANENNTLIDADYSQIELRVLASLAEDKNMIEAFLSGEDIHTNTASQVFNLPPLFITPQMRSRAKAVNFGIVYGIGAFSLSKDIGVSVAEADGYIKNYLKTYEGVKEYLDTTVEKARKNGYVKTYFGRRRYLPELKSSNKNIIAFGERVAKNMPIQGTAADIIKIAMIRVYKELKKQKLNARLILQVHDELIVESSVEDAEKVREIVKDVMEHSIKLAVPMIADTNIGKNWGEAH